MSAQAQDDEPAAAARQPNNSQIVEEAFGPEEISNGQPTTGQPTTEGTQSDSRSSQTSGYQTLSGVEQEGIRTHSFPLSRIYNTALFSESLPTGLLRTTVVVPGAMNRMDTDFCTATLIDFDVVITAYHCFPGTTQKRRDDGYEARRAEVQFGFYDENAYVETYRVAKVIDADRDLDFAILKLAPKFGSPFAGQMFGYINVSLDPVGDRQLRMFHHPYGYFKMVLQDATCRSLVRDDTPVSQFYHQCDTRGGSSGAAVLGYEVAMRENLWRPVAFGIHIAGRDKGLSDPQLHFNVAVPMTAIAEKSEYIRKTGCRTGGQGMECPDPTFARTYTIYFDPNSTQLSPQAQAGLDFVIGLIEKAKGTNTVVKGILLQGYSENLPGSSPAYAVGVSARRAEAIADYMIQRGIAGADIVREPRGADGAPSGANLELRRVDIIVDYDYIFD